MTNMNIELRKSLQAKNLELIKLRAQKLNGTS